MAVLWRRVRYVSGAEKLMKRYMWLFLLLGLMVCSAGQRGLPAREGIRNFGKVNETVYRGAQPDAAAIRNLKKLGIKSIVNLRTSGAEWKKEVAQAQESGIVCTNIPLNGIRRPTHEEVRKVLDAIKALPPPVFIHCQHGCDRTGTIVACYRIEYENWSNQAALAEAERYGISKLERGMRDFILHYRKQSENPEARALRLGTPKQPGAEGAKNST